MHAQEASKVNIDLNLIKKKQEILFEYYGLIEQKPAIELLSRWPSDIIADHLAKNPLITKTNNANYVGEMSNEMFHGQGLLIYEQPKGRFYEGHFQNNCKHGDGLEYIAGDLYVGKFINNKPEDTNGVFMWKNGDIFVGSFVNGMKHGQGKWQSGSDTYEGTWKLNRPEGNGIIHTDNSDYEGEIKNGYKHGKGIEIFANGDQYRGWYANGKPEGEGVYLWNNGAVYKGHFKNGIRYGYGQWSLGIEKYEGNYVNDRRNGSGLYTWGTQSYYNGQFVDDLRHGFGQMHWSESTFYRGQWNEGIQSGEGQLWEEGVLVSKGKFEDGRLIHSRSPKSKNNHIANSSRDSSTRYTPHENTPHDNNKKFRRSSYYSSLGQIDQLSSNKSQKRVTSLFSHPNAKKSKVVPRSRETDLTEKQVPNVKQKIYLPQKKQLFRTHKSSSHDKMRVEKQKSLLTNNKNRNQIGLIEANETNVTNQTKVANQTQLGPIKWRNFRHVKRQGNLPSVPQC